jgi:hypothetical protein
MHLFRMIMLVVLSLALPFQGYALAGMRACNMSHAPVDKVNATQMGHTDITPHGMHGHTQGHVEAVRDTDPASSNNQHSNHSSTDSSCQCSASCIGSGLMSEYLLVQLQQERPVYAQVHSKLVLQAPIKRLDRPPRYLSA